MKYEVNNTLLLCLEIYQDAQQQQMKNNLYRASAEKDSPGWGWGQTPPPPPPPPPPKKFIKIKKKKKKKKKNKKKKKKKKEKEKEKKKKKKKTNQNTTQRNKKKKGARGGGGAPPPPPPPPHLLNQIFQNIIRTNEPIQFTGQLHAKQERETDVTEPRCRRQKSNNNLCYCIPNFQNFI